MFVIELFAYFQIHRDEF